MAATPFIPLEDFREVELVPARGRTEVVLPGQVRPSQVADRIDEVREARHSRGMEWLLEQLLEHVKQVLWDARANNRKKSDDWDLWFDQKEGILPEKGPGMISNVGHNVMVQVYSALHGHVQELVFANGFFAYDPPGHDDSAIGRKIANSLERIVYAQLDTPDFEEETYNFGDCDSTFGYALASAEYEQHYQPQLINGQYTEQIIDRGTVFRNIVPYYAGFRNWQEPDWQKQGAIIYQTELSIPQLISEHLAAIVEDLQVDQAGVVRGGAVYPSGSYFNLAKLWEKIKNQTTMPQRAVKRDSAKIRDQYGEADTQIKRVLAFNCWTQDIDMPRLVSKAMSRSDGPATPQEIFLTLGWTPDQITNCRRWKLTAVDTSGGLSYGSEPDVIIQARANPYKHGLFPIIGTQCIPFPARAMGIGYGELLYYLQLAMNTLLTLNVDNAIRDSVDMWLIAKDAIAGLTAEDEVPLEQGLILEWNPSYGGPREAKNVMQRLGPGAEARVAWPEGAAMLERIFAIMQNVAGIQRPPFPGRRTATEIAEIVKGNLMSLTSIVAAGIRRAMTRFAEQLTMNNAQFMLPETAIDLGGKAGLDFGLVQEVQQQLGGPISIYPVRVKATGKRRMMDRITQGQLMAQLTNTPLFMAHLQIRMAGGRMPKDLENLLVRMWDMLGVEDVDSLLPQEDKIPTEQVVALLGRGIPVDVDITRFQGPEEIIRELGAVRALADRGSMLAEDYFNRLRRVFQQMMMQTAMAQQMGAMGQQGQGQRQMMGGPGIAGMLPAPAGQAGLPRGAMNEAQAIVMNEVPTNPVAGGV